MPDLKHDSPLNTYINHCGKGELAYQVCRDDNTPVFFPRLVAPITGSANLEWRISKGLGTVYATTVIYYKNEAPLNVALIDLDEGFRMMSRVEDIDPAQVKIGMRVTVRMHPGDDKQPPYPVFTAAILKGKVSASAAPPPPAVSSSAGKSRKAKPVTGGKGKSASLPSGKKARGSSPASGGKSKNSAATTVTKTHGGKRGKSK